MDEVDLIRRVQEAAGGEVVVMGLVEQVVRAAVEVGIVEGVRLADPQTGEQQVAFYRGMGEVGRIVEEVAGRMLRGSGG